MIQRDLKLREFNGKTYMIVEPNSNFWNCMTAKPLFTPYSQFAVDVDTGELIVIPGIEKAPPQPKETFKSRRLLQYNSEYSQWYTLPTDFKEMMKVLDRYNEETTHIGLQNGIESWTFPKSRNQQKLLMIRLHRKYVKGD